MSWENFTLEEFACKHCGENKIEHELIDKLQLLRTELGFPVTIGVPGAFLFFSTGCSAHL